MGYHNLGVAILVSCKLYVICKEANIFSMYLVYLPYSQFYLQHLCCGDSNVSDYLLLCLRIRSYLHIYPWRENLDWFTAQIERTISEYFTT